MCELTIKNFVSLSPVAERSLRKAEFIGIDLELSGLPFTTETQYSPFDENDETYQKARINMEEVIPMQMGLTAFIFCPKKKMYVGQTFTCYLQPASFKAGGVNRPFHLQSSKMSILKAKKFDCDKWFNHAIPYLNKQEVQQLQAKLDGDVDYASLPNIDLIRTMLIECYKTISEWYEEAEENDCIDLEILEEYVGNQEMTFVFHKAIRGRYKNLGTFEEYGKFIIQKLSALDYETYLPEVEDEVVQYLKGFTHFFELFVSLQKPIVGHNLFLDLLVLINNFHDPLPETYKEYKNIVNKLFPTVYDTKTLFNKFKDYVPDNEPKSSSLEHLFEYFKTYSKKDEPMIEYLGRLWPVPNAGWNSYRTGYIFTKMATWLLKECTGVLPRRIFEAVASVKNCVNIMDTTQFIRLDSGDPVPKRHQKFMVYVVKSITGEEIDLEEMSRTLLYVYFKSSSQGKVMVMTDSRKTRNELIAYVKTVPNLTIKPYNDEDNEESLSRAIYNQKVFRTTYT